MIITSERTMIHLCVNKALDYEVAIVQLSLKIIDVEIMAEM